VRIVKGRFAGRALMSPGRRVRPTPESVRDRLLDLVADELQGCRFLDLFAGSGAVGIEAVSRGAKSTDFVENGAAALHALKANVAALHLGKRARVFKKDVLPWIHRLPSGSYGVGWVDPPYGSLKLDRVVERWSEVRFVDVLIVEHDREHVVPASGTHYDFEGPTRVTILRA
jgi:16S rRNA (guanine966-N2)-methyltransferase